MRQRLKWLVATLMMLLTLALPYRVHSLQKGEKNYVSKNVMIMIFDDISRNSNTYPGTLRLVCKDWKEIADTLIELDKGRPYKNRRALSQKWLQEKYGVPGHEEAFKTYINGKLICTPNEGTDKGKIELQIVDLPNPFEGRFDLSMCSPKLFYLGFYTGFRQSNRMPNDSIQVWFAPRFLIEKFLKSSAKHFESIMSEWDEKNAPIGIFWTFENCEDLDWYDYVINTTPDSLSNENLCKVWKEKGSASKNKVRLYDTTNVTPQYLPFSCAFVTK